MAIRVVGKNLKLSEELRSHIEDKIVSVVGKYFDGTYDGHVMIDKDGSDFRTECLLHLSSGATVQSVACFADLYQSFDRSVARIERRLQRYKDKLKHHRWPVDAKIRAGVYRVLEAPSVSDDGKVADEYAPMIIAETQHRLRELAVADAVIELDMSDKVCVVFNNVEHGGVNVVYRRHDGAIGWIDPIE